MSGSPARAEELRVEELQQRLDEAEATIHALLSGQIDAVVDAESHTPVLLSKAQDALRESEERYRRIVEATTDGIFQIDAAGVILFVNRRFAALLGHDAGQLLGRSIFELMNADARAIALGFLRPDAELLSTVDSTFQHADGSDISVNIAGSRLRAGEADAGYLGMVRDVTERNKLQSQLMVSDRMASVGTLAAGVAHEINNPLAAVIANLDFVTESLSTARDAAAGSKAAGLCEQLRSPVEDAREAAHRVRVIVRDLKVFSHSPEEREIREAVDVEATMESSLRIAWNEIRHRAQLVKAYGAVPPVEANAPRLGQVFLNLLVNAAQAIPEGRAEHNAISVSTRLEGDRVIIEVTDTGAGIPPAILGRVFDAFFTTKAVGVGTGLGLAICHRIVTDMGGALTVESELGKGTTFRVTLAASRRAPSIRPAAPAVIPIAPRQDPRGGRRAARRPQHPAGPRQRARGRDEDRCVGGLGPLHRWGEVRSDPLRPDDAGHERHGVPPRADALRPRTGGAHGLHDRRRVHAGSHDLSRDAQGAHREAVRGGRSTADGARLPALTARPRRAVPRFRFRQGAGAVTVLPAMFTAVCP